LYGGQPAPSPRTHPPGSVPPPASAVPIVPGRLSPAAPPPPPEPVRGIGVIGGRGRPIRSHGRRKSRLPAWTLIFVVLGLVAVGAGIRFVPNGPFTSSTGPGASAGPTLAPLPLRAANITLESVKTTGFLSWAVLDRRTSEIFGSSNMDATSATASMIKAWMAAEYLRKNAAPPQDKLDDLEIMIRDSDNDAADRTYTSIGGTAGIQDMVSVCSLTDSQAVKGWWSQTLMSARDVVRLGQCIGDGRAAGPKWTPWLIDKMQKVRGDGDFGIRKAFPAAQQPQIAIKNGWLLSDDDGAWHTNCLAIGDTWVMSVMQRYPANGNYSDDDFNHTADVCQNVAKLLLTARA
jgi:hypothetical protein